MRRAALLGLLVVGACSVLPRPGLLPGSTGDVGRLTTRQVRLLLNDYVRRFTVEVEASADEIFAATSDLAIQRNALLWKIHAVPAGYRAGSLEDPLAAFFDLWILAEQMRAFLEEGAGRNAFGEHQPDAVRTATLLVEWMHDLAGRVTTGPEGFERARELAESLAREAPVEHLTFARSSVVPAYVDSIEGEERAVFEIVGSVTESLAALQELVVTYGSQLPSIARWQAELLLLDVTRYGPVASVPEDFGRVATFLEALTPVTVDAPELLERERKAIFEEIRGEREAFLMAMEEIRVDTDLQLGDQRAAFFGALAFERQAAQEALAAERVAVFEGLDRVIDRATGLVSAEARDLVDLLFERALWIVAAGTAGGLFVVGFGTAMARRRA